MPSAYTPICPWFWHRGCEKIPWQGLPAAAPECCGWKPLPRFSLPGTVPTTTTHKTHGFSVFSPTFPRANTARYDDDSTD